MDKYLAKYESIVKSDKKNEFLQEEDKYFPKGTSLEDKVKAEFIRINAMYHSKLTNEAYYSNNQMSVILDSLDNIEKLIDDEKYRHAAVFIIALELLMGMDIKLTKTLTAMINENISIHNLIFESKYETVERKIGFQKRRTDEFDFAFDPDIDKPKSKGGK